MPFFPGRVFLTQNESSSLYIFIIPIIPLSDPPQPVPPLKRNITRDNCMFRVRPMLNTDKIDQVHNNYCTCRKKNIIFVHYKIGSNFKV